MGINSIGEDEDDEEGPEAFEDNPMPVLKGSVRVSDKLKKVKILVDSGPG